jgi:hypothetical protein
MHLEHLDVCYAQVEVGCVAKDKRCTEEQTDGKDRAQEHILGNVHIFCAVQEMGRSRQDAGSNGLWQNDCWPSLTLRMLTLDNVPRKSDARSPRRPGT